MVAGIRTPQPVAEMVKWRPEIYEQLLEIKQILENHYREMEDIEYTIERGTLFLLQTRTGKRTGPAAVKIAVEMVTEGRITEQEALRWRRRRGLDRQRVVMNDRLRIVFMGSPDFAVPCLKALVRRHDVVAVVTQPDRPKGRGRAMTPPPVALRWW